MFDIKSNLEQRTDEQLQAIADSYQVSTDELERVEVINSLITAITQRLEQFYDPQRVKLMQQLTKDAEGSEE